ncbi:MAG: hypothetical protein EOP45_11940, partial [Sphingobacteriaceae bacterium]
MNAEQYVAFQDVLAGSNVLLSSAGGKSLSKSQNSFFHKRLGTGKSYVLKKIIDELTTRGKRFQVTSTSGRTAVLLGGLTIHRFLRITPACHNLEDYIKGFRTKRTAQIFKNLDILIIDEIGMLTNDFFTLISDILDYERETGLPFGGVIQVIHSA